MLCNAQFTLLLGIFVVVMTQSSYVANVVFACADALLVKNDVFPSWLHFAVSIFSGADLFVPLVFPFLCAFPQVHSNNFSNFPPGIC